MKVRPTVQLQMDRASKRKILEARRNMFLRNVRALNRDLKAGRITVTRWEARMAEEVKDLFITSYVSGKSGRWDEMDFSDYGSIGAMLRKQYQFLRRWKAQIADEGVEEVSLAKLDDRAQMYGQASDQAFEQGRASEVGLDPSVLPAWPGDATTRCRVRCKCSWFIEVVDQQREDFNATWRLGDAEHCIHCLARAGSWVGLRIRNNVLIDQPEPIFR